MDYGFTHDGKVFTPDGTAGIDPADNNAGTWLSTSDADINYRTGEHRYESLHLKREDGSELTAHQTRRILKAAGVI